MNRKRRETIKSNEICELRTYRLSGYDQKVLLEGRHRTAPLLVFLHGGPGSPVPFSAGCRGMFPEITGRFIVVYWDQLGCGINDRIIDDSFSIGSYVNMTIELIKMLKADFPEQPINLFGISWGSVLAAKAALQVPELIHRVVTYGQVLKKLFFNDEVFGALEGLAIPQRVRQQLCGLRAQKEYSPDNVKSMAAWIRKYTEGYQAKAGGKTPLGKILFGLLTSPDYSFKDFKAITVNGTMKNNSLIKELIAVDLNDTLERGHDDRLIAPPAVLARWQPLCCGKRP